MLLAWPCSPPIPLAPPRPENGLDEIEAPGIRDKAGKPRPDDKK